jgi:acetyl-CoA acetyltransferase
MAPIFKMGIAVGGCSFMIYLRHAAAAIASGLCETVLITHGESGRSGIRAHPQCRDRRPASPASLSGPMGRWGRRLCSRSPCCGYMKTYGLTHKQLAMVSVVQGEWAATNPRATFKAPITVVIGSLGLVPISSSSRADGSEDPQQRNRPIATLASYSSWIGACEPVQDCL